MMVDTGKLCIHCKHMVKSNDYGIPLEYLVSCSKQLSMVTGSFLLCREARVAWYPGSCGPDARLFQRKESKP